MSGAPKIPPETLQALLLAQSRAELAQERFLRLRAEVERDLGVRLDRANIAADGTVTIPEGPA